MFLIFFVTIQTDTLKTQALFQTNIGGNFKTRENRIPILPPDVVNYKIKQSFTRFEITTKNKNMLSLTEIEQKKLAQSWIQKIK